MLAMEPRAAKRRLAGLTSNRFISLAMSRGVSEKLYDLGGKEPEYGGYGYESRLRELRGKQRRLEQREEGILILARVLVPWNPKEKSDNDTRQLYGRRMSECIVEGDTWATFLALRRRYLRSEGTPDEEEILNGYSGRAYEEDELIRREDADRIELLLREQTKVFRKVVEAFGSQLAALRTGVLWVGLGIVAVLVILLF